MSTMADQHHTPAAWLPHEASRVANGYDAAATGMLPSEDISDMFFPHSLDSNAGHMNAGYYSSSAARAVQAYRNPHGEWNRIIVDTSSLPHTYVAFVSRFGGLAVRR